MDAKPTFEFYFLCFVNSGHVHNAWASLLGFLSFKTQCVLPVSSIIVSQVKNFLRSIVVYPKRSHSGVRSSYVTDECRELPKKSERHQSLTDRRIDGKRDRNDSHLTRKCCLPHRCSQLVRKTDCSTSSCFAQITQPSPNTHWYRHSDSSTTVYKQQLRFSNVHLSDPKGVVTSILYIFYHDLFPSFSRVGLIVPINKQRLLMLPCHPCPPGHVWQTLKHMAPQPATSSTCKILENTPLEIKMKRVEIYHIQIVYVFLRGQNAVRRSALCDELHTPASSLSFVVHH